MSVIHVNFKNRKMVKKYRTRKQKLMNFLKKLSYEDIALNLLVIIMAGILVSLGIVAMLGRMYV